MIVGVARLAARYPNIYYRTFKESGTTIILDEDSELVRALVGTG